MIFSENRFPSAFTSKACFSASSADRQRADDRLGCELVVAGSHAMALLDLVEEPLDQVACSVAIVAEADCTLATAALPLLPRISSSFCARV
jgi:hypothetical protein